MAKRDNDRAAQILLEATLFKDDPKVCEKWGITLRTLQNYRAALGTDAELSQCVTELTRKVQTQTWLQKLESTMSALLQKIECGLEGVTPDGLGDVGRLVTILESLAEIKLSRDMYGVDEAAAGAEASGAGAESAARGEGQGAAQPFGPS